MSLSGKREFTSEIKSPRNVFHEYYGSKKYNLPKICPDKLPMIELLEGNWGDVGCIFSVQYLIEGEIITLKEKVVAADEEKMSMTCDYFEGDLMKYYKTYKVTFQITSKDEKNFINWTIEYEKLNADLDVPDLDKMVEFIIEITNILDAHFVNNTCHVQAN